MFWVCTILAVVIAALIVAYGLCSASAKADWESEEEERW